MEQIKYHVERGDNGYVFKDDELHCSKVIYDEHLPEEIGTEIAAEIREFTDHNMCNAIELTVTIKESEERL